MMTIKTKIYIFKRIISFVVFNSVQKHNSYLDLVFFLFRCDSTL